MSKVKVGVAGYGVIGQRLADGVALQGDMELVGVADAAPTISVQALKAKGMPYKMFNALPESRAMEEAGIPVSVREGRGMEIGAACGQLRRQWEEESL